VKIKDGSSFSVSSNRSCRTSTFSLTTASNQSSYVSFFSPFRNYLITLSIIPHFVIPRQNLSISHSHFHVTHCFLHSHCSLFCQLPFETRKKIKTCMIFSSFYSLIHSLQSLFSISISFHLKGLILTCGIIQHHIS